MRKPIHQCQMGKPLPFAVAFNVEGRGFKSCQTTRNAGYFYKTYEALVPRQEGGTKSF